MVENPTRSKNSEVLENMPFLRIFKSDKIYLPFLTSYSFPLQVFLVSEFTSILVFGYKRNKIYFQLL